MDITDTFKEEFMEEMKSIIETQKSSAITAFKIDRILYMLKKGYSKAVICDALDVQEETIDFVAGGNKKNLR